MTKIKVMVAEDHQLFRDGLVKQLEEDDFQVIGSAENGRILIDLIKGTIPEVLLLDLRMPELNGQGVLEILAKDFPEVKTIVLSGEYSDFYVAEVILKGARAYLRKNVPFSEVVKAINQVHNEGYYFNEVVSKDILDQLKSQKKIYYIINNERFSEREIEVIRELCKDIKVDLIADNLNIADSTVNYHKYNIMSKTESDTIVSLVKYAIRQGIVDINEI